MHVRQRRFTGIEAGHFVRLALRRLGGLTNVGGNAAQIAMAQIGPSMAAGRSLVCLPRDSSRGRLLTSQNQIHSIHFHASR